MQHSLEWEQASAASSQKNHPAIINPSRPGKNNPGGISLMKILQ
ncbi:MULTISPECIES: hypothetical protein [Pseudomonas]|nr:MULTISPECIES: hypothetical protein [Pseudomonas]